MIKWYCDQCQNEMKWPHKSLEYTPIFLPPLQVSISSIEKDFCSWKCIEIFCKIQNEAEEKRRAIR